MLAVQRQRSIERQGDDLLGLRDVRERSRTDVQFR